MIILLILQTSSNMAMVVILSRWSKGRVALYISTYIHVFSCQMEATIYNIQVMYPLPLAASPYTSYGRPKDISYRCVRIPYSHYQATPGENIKWNKP